ncbi:unnamed protein product [Cylicostephanus goldi]|uniref:RNA-directed DNA polymerase n=1 Tax=Cylicostephanus goldi TaxID=71465 RepID=A0A3P7MJQ5_CYLGO|nr:unnamed protein product [Cylicostephanus goldi]
MSDLSRKSCVTERASSNCPKKELHVGHPGIVRMKKLARSYVYWLNVIEDCKDLVRRCTKCQVLTKNPTEVSLSSTGHPRLEYGRGYTLISLDQRKESSTW